MFLDVNSKVIDRLSVHLLIEEFMVEQLVPLAQLSAHHKSYN